MKLEISASLNYRLPEPVDLMLQIEAADGGGQHVEQASLDLGHPDYVARVPAAGSFASLNVSNAAAVALYAAAQGRRSAVPSPRPSRGEG